MNRPRKVAVIDIGSNSCRLVIYEHFGAGLLPYFNEKTMAGLGRDLSETGLLSGDGKRKALETLRRFRAILEGLGIDNIVAVATAAVREAKDGPDFQSDAEAALGLPVSVLSGADEGRLAARGVTVGFGGFEGLVADLGGSSMELQACQRGEQVSAAESFLLGPLARFEDEKLSLARRQHIVMDTLKASGHAQTAPERLIAVGGAWRNLAAVHMMLSEYPLRVVNGYTLSRKQLGKVISVLSSGKDKALLQRIEKLAKKRFGTLLHGAIVLDSLLETTGAEQATISAYGLRDGVIAEHIGLSSQAEGITDTSQLFLNLSDDSMAFGSSLTEFVAPLFGDSHGDWDTIRTSCQMADAGARMHPDHRPELIFQQIVRAPLPDLDHRARLLAASALGWRYTYRFNLPAEMDPLLSSPDQKFARILGTAMRLGGAFSGRSSSILTTTRLELTDEALIMRVWNTNRDLISGTVKRRLRQLAGLVDREPEIELVERF